MSSALFRTPVAVRDGPKLGDVSMLWIERCEYIHQLEDI
jgi:hypothetical protein